MEYYYCFACRKLFQSDDSHCLRCGKGGATARRELAKSTPHQDTYRIYVGERLVARQRVQK